MSKMSQEQSYRYRAMAFSGVRSFTGVATGGSRVCSIVACTGNTMDTCGSRFGSYALNTTAHFEELTITGTIPTPQLIPDLEADDSIVYPVSSTVSIMPLEPSEYIYSTSSSGDNTIHVYTLVNTNAELYTFALWSRVFETDGLEEDPPRPEYSLSVVHVVNRLLLVFVVGFVYFVRY